MQTIRRRCSPRIFAKEDSEASDRFRRLQADSQLGDRQGLGNRIVGLRINIGEDGIRRAKVDADTESGRGYSHDARI